MAVDVRHVPVPVPVPHVPVRRRLFGLGSVFGKTVRDSRLAAVVVGGLLGAIIVAGGGAMGETYGTLAARRELALMAQTLPAALRGVYGNPVAVDTLGGFLSWHYGAYFALLAGLWSILALSSTLAGEAARGALDFAAATPNSRRSIALQKLAGHVAAMVAVLATVALVAWATGAIFEEFPGDAISPDRAVAFAIGLGVRGLVAGSIAFALAPVVGRGAAAGLAGAIMLGGYVVYGYRGVVPAFDSVAGTTWFSWTAGHVPLAGQWDWGGLGVAAAVTVVLLALGIEAFARRDVGVTAAIPFPHLPTALLGVTGTFRRSLGDLLPRALAWGVGLGVYGLLMAGSSQALLDLLNSSPGYVEAIRRILPSVEMTTAAGFLQFAFVDLGLVLVALAAATFVAVRSSDETEGRLELQLATPLSRARWTLESAVAVLAAIALTTAILGGAIGLGVAAIGQDPLGPMTATAVLALYAAALAGVGVAVAGVVGAPAAVPVVVGLALGTFLVDLLGPTLRLPDWLQQLALTTHLGEPMVGRWDQSGIISCLALATAGLAIGAWGMARRDVRG